MTINQHQNLSNTYLSARRITPLATQLIESIKRSGPISVAQYVEACLKDPKFGYYIHSSAIGSASDFITSPEISQVFGELIGVWCTVVWNQMGKPKKLNLLELGPGRGTLMSDIMRTFAKSTEFQAHINLHLLESNNFLRRQQEDILKNKAPSLTHYKNTKSICEAALLTDAPWIVIGNEFLDTFSVNQFIAQQNFWHERTVKCTSDNRLEFAIGKPAVPHFDIDFNASSIPDGEILETLPAIETIILPLLKTLMENAPLAVLLIDYGHESTGFGDTLQAIRAHRYEHPLTSPGQADLTTQVDFSQISRVLRRSGLIPHSILTQAEFLGRLGVVERTSQLMSNNPKQASVLETATTRLIAPNGMGTRFKALALSSPKLHPLPIFMPLIM
ncbi:MAG: hypothetical protein TECD_00156 [Hyphomicrobiaceae bacterium hypho_1]